jgi:hypothetical protein
MIFESISGTLTAKHRERACTITAATIVCIVCTLFGTTLLKYYLISSSQDFRVSVKRKRYTGISNLFFVFVLLVFY